MGKKKTTVAKFEESRWVQELDAEGNPIGEPKEVNV